MNARVRQTVRQLCTAGNSDDFISDGELVGAFIASRDADAFSSLVRRHGPMVFGVCRRVLGNRHDAEDAFQATFLVFVRRAATVQPRERFANWLYGVAYRTSLEARRMAARRRAREAQLQNQPRPTPAAPVEPDVTALLDEELSRLPDRLRLPVVLCDLEGRTRRAVARELGIADGTLSNRLSTARRLLASRLCARGVMLSAGSLAIPLAQTGSTAVPKRLMESTVHAAFAPTAELASAAVKTLTHEVVKTMYLNKLKTLIAMILIGAVIGGAGIAWGGRSLTAASEPVRQSAPVASKPPSASDADMKSVLAKAADAMQEVQATSDEALRARRVG